MVTNLPRVVESLEPRFKPRRGRLGLGARLPRRELRRFPSSPPPLKVFIPIPAEGKRDLPTGSLEISPFALTMSTTYSLPLNLQEVPPPHSGVACFLRITWTECECIGGAFQHDQSSHLKYLLD
ncbi:hypothetical protein ACLOJK_032418 [Asimina triloba]